MADSFDPGAVSTDATSGLREDLRKGRTVQIPRSTTQQADAAAAHFGISTGHLVRLLLDYALRDHAAGLVEIHFPPGEARRKNPTQREDE